MRRRCHQQSQLTLHAAIEVMLEETQRTEQPLFAAIALPPAYPTCFAVTPPPEASCVQNLAT
jgi:hypothetical protein